MPKKDMDYSKSIVYKICCNDIAIKDCYVGSTTSLVKRRYSHKSKCNNEKNKSYNLNVYKFIRANGGFDNWSVVLIQEYPECKSREELLKYERQQMELLDATLNSEVPGRTKKEYQQDNKEYYVEYHKKYQQDNKESLAEYKKEWRENNKESIAEYDKKYYQDNKERIAEKIKERIICERCGIESNKGHINRHQKSKSCLATQTD
jgi:hypothetical protein